MNTSQFTGISSSSVIPFTFAPAVDDLQELLSILEDVTEWHQLCLNLGVKESSLETVDSGFRNPMDAKREMLKLWLKQAHQIAGDAGVGATWRSLIKALTNMGYNVLAKRIEDEVRIKMNEKHWLLVGYIALSEFCKFLYNCSIQRVVAISALWKVHHCQQLDLHQSQLRIDQHLHLTLHSKYVRVFFRTYLMNSAS